jgi:UDP-N-acetylmuramoyl-L-alanyl-D-glutamate--2,6-diaminopimelate ligase
LSFDVSLNGDTAHIDSRLFGRFNIDNMVSAIAVLVAVGDSFEAASKKLQHVKSVVGRMQFVSGNSSAPTVVVDYAHTPDALRQALLSLREHCEGKLKLVFGCGGDRDEAKRPLMGAIATELADEVTITNDNPRHESKDEIVRHIKSGMADLTRVDTVFDRKQAIEQVVVHAAPNDIILVAGKGHENYQHIGDKKEAFSDIDEIKKALICRAGEGGCEP